MTRKGQDIRVAMRNEVRNRGRHDPDGRDANAAMGVRRTKPKRAARR